MDHTTHIERAKILAMDIETMLIERGRLNPHTHEVSITALAYVLRGQLSSTPDNVKKETLAGISELVCIGSEAVVFPVIGQIK
ncbi:hypothetical protein ACQU0X_23965 [Pseudovibrio ascidiaceicola]|uniref:hypothetical protein n=1 Tax=Pseudovibrio ascidiaceicola TaxID=285279 RepID=UPI003D361700